MRRSIATAVILLLCSCVSAGARTFISQLGDASFLLGGPVLSGATRDNTSIKFEFSLLVCPIELSEDWTVALAYSQKSIWNAFAESSPFLDNTYMPAIFAECVLDGDNVIETGLEHRSNGRPYYGNMLAHEGYDDYSRGMNYAYVRWKHRLGPEWKMVLCGRAGAGCGVGDYSRHQQMYTQDLFLYYLGYVDAIFMYDTGTFGAGLKVTPLWNRSIANVTVEGSWQFNERLPRLAMQFHYGFDGAMCTCVKDGRPPFDVRIGLKINCEMR